MNIRPQDVISSTSLGNYDVEEVRGTANTALLGWRLRKKECVHWKPDRMSKNNDFRQKRIRRIFKKHAQMK